eukprot:CAMPEP_0201738740 /NCGR_PEP_ID=MMETSP0593-20130828/45410_1 /ASSEMBLY_ACC=CAM_ASM_000672 /TAXON_ID=267983 /ORGANISM="Skeletonema japonicum, Strain CCMP2506" /LENGTH=562 /DNA_ID=CAMNT_0048232967 /DNA_START=150 /DNA_END=1838 /DNA_ORIENTATION=-
MSSIQEIKALVTTSEHEVQIAKDAVKATERGIEEAYERNRIARANHDGLVIKLANLKAQFKERIMEDGLKEFNGWNEMYYKLLQWKESHDGDVLVPVDKDSDEDAKKLSRWVINQRSAYKYFINGDTKHIKDHRIDALNKIGFVWCVADHVFQANVEGLKQYHAENKKFDVSVKENKKLAAFVSRAQRSAYKYFMNGDTKHIKDHRIDALNKIGFVCCVADHVFQANVEDLKQYHAENNKFDVPVNENQKLAAFVSRVRTAYANKQGGRAEHDLTDEQITQLDAIGFKWGFKNSRKRTTSTSTAFDFDTQIAILQEFKDEYGHTKVNKLTNVEGLKQYHAENNKFDVSVKENKKLAAFVSRARTAYANKQEGRAQHDLTDEKIDQLDAIGFKWGFKKSRKRKTSTSNAFDFDTQIAILQEFKDEYGHTKVNKLIKEWQKGEGEPSKKEYRRLPVFLTFARKEYISFAEGQPSLIDAEKINALTELGVEWKQPPGIPRKNTGGEATRKKKHKIEAPSHEEEYKLAAAELDVEAELPPLSASAHVPVLPSPHLPRVGDGQSTMI